MPGFFSKAINKLAGSSDQAYLARRLESAHKRIARQEKQIHSLRRLSAENISPENIVWIFGAGRTGSTWLAAMMGDVSGCAVWFEPQLGLLFDPDRTEVGRRRGKSFVFAPQYKDTWLESIRSFVLDGAGARFPELSPEEYLLVKEPHGSAGAPLLLEALPESRAVLLLRDPRDVVASALDAVRKGPWSQNHRQGMYGGEEAVAAKENPDAFVQSAAREYLRHAGNAREAHEAHGGPKTVVRYEDLRSDALGTMKRAYAELEIPVDEAELAGAVEKHAWENVPEEEKGEGKFYRKATPGGWREDLTEEQTRIVEEATGSLLEEFYSERHMDTGENLGAIWIVSGPTSVGKSTFMESPRCAEITGLPSDAPVVLPADHSPLDGSSGALYHYNILRPLDLKCRYEQPEAPANRPVIRDAEDFGQDPRWKDLADRGIPKKAIILVAGRETIMQRARQRRTIESAGLSNRGETTYPARHWLDLLEQADLVALYRAWCGELRSRGIPYVLVNSDGDDYPAIESEEHLSNVVNGSGSGYTKEQIQKILRERRFAYHRIDLPFGLHTKGDDRSSTRDMIFPEPLAGKTVLDVGSALGYFCFEAEAKDAARVVGVELKEERFNDAVLLKDIKGSGVEFLQRDIIENPLDESFDYILLLNVIHHLKEPFRVMRQLATITNERLIIEFPTFSDRKFRKTANVRFPFLYNRLPLIGVSSQAQADQTFVYTPSAIKRTLLDHERLFERVDIVRSPMPGRMIAICRKETNV